MTDSRPPDGFPIGDLGSPRKIWEESDLRQQLGVFVARYCPGWLKDNQDDIVQAAWMRLHPARGNPEGIGPLGTSLLARAAYCATVDEIRRRQRRKEVPLGDACPLTHDAAGPLAQVGARELRRAIAACMAGLRDERRFAVALYLQGHSVPEAGRILDWPVKRAENMVFRGLADLRRCLAGKGYTP